MNELNIYAKIIIGLNILVIILFPAVIGQEKKSETFTFGEWISKIISFIFLLLAFEVI